MLYEVITSVTIVAVAVDTSGNKKTMEDATLLSFNIADNQPPSISIESATVDGTPSITFNQGQDVKITLSAADDAALSSLSFMAKNGDVFRWQKSLSGEKSCSFNFTFTIPADSPANESFELVASATDNQGVIAVSDKITLTIKDRNNFV